jgi:hypothetical protein
MKKYYIYKTTNKITNMQYIGSHHGNVNDSYFGSGLAISRAIEKYGKHNFKKEIIEIVNNKDLLLEREKYWLEKFNCAINPKYYNLTNVAGGGFMSDGKTDEERKIIREKQEIGRRAKRKETVKKMLLTKQNWSKEKKQALGKAISDGKTKQPEWKKRETGKKISLAKRYVWQTLTEEEKLKHGEMLSKKWQVLTEEEKLKHGEKMKKIRSKQIMTSERKIKTSNTLKNNWKNLPDNVKKIRVEHMGNIVRGKQWCNNGTKNFRKTPEQIKKLNYILGKIKYIKRACNNGVRNFYKTPEQIKELGYTLGRL